MDQAFLNPETDAATLRGIVEAWRPEAVEISRLLKEDLPPAACLILGYRLLTQSALDQSAAPPLSLAVARAEGLEEEVAAISAWLATRLPLLGARAVFADALKTGRLAPDYLVALLLSDRPFAPSEVPGAGQTFPVLADYAGLRLRRISLARRLFALSSNLSVAKFALCRSADGQVDSQSSESTTKKPVGELCEAAGDVAKMVELARLHASYFKSEGLSQWVDVAVHAAKIRSLKRVSQVYSALPVHLLLKKTGIASVSDLHTVVDWSRSSDQRIEVSFEANDIARF